MCVRAVLWSFCVGLQGKQVNTCVHLHVKPVVILRSSCADLQLLCRFGFAHRTGCEKHDIFLINQFRFWEFFNRHQHSCTQLYVQIRITHTVNARHGKNMPQKLRARFHTRHSSMKMREAISVTSHSTPSTRPAPVTAEHAWM